MALVAKTSPSASQKHCEDVLGASCRYNFRPSRVTRLDGCTTPKHLTEAPHCPVSLLPEQPVKEWPNSQDEAERGLSIARRDAARWQPKTRSQVHMDSEGMQAAHLSKVVHPVVTM